jgi:hypothetical protein
MTRQYTRLVNIQRVPNATGVLYTNPSGTKTFVKGFSFYNAGAVSGTVALFNVPDDAAATGIPSSGNKITEIVLASTETFLLEYPYPITMIDEGDSIQGYATTVSDVTIQILGDTDL